MTAPASPARYTRTDTRIAARVGDEFVLTLDSQPAAGYQWQGPADHPLVVLIDRQVASAGPGVGSGGRETLRWRCRAAGAAPLTLRYQRPWEAQAADQMTIALTVR